KGIAGFFGQQLANATISVELDFQDKGRVFFRGNTQVLGLPPDSDGTWSVSEAEPNVLNIRFGTDKKQLTGKVLFRDKNEFTLKLDEPPPVPAPPPAAKDAANDPKDSAKEQPAPVTNIVFRRSTG